MIPGSSSGSSCLSDSITSSLPHTATLTPSHCHTLPARYFDEGEAEEAWAGAEGDHDTAMTITAEAEGPSGRGGVLGTAMAGGKHGVESEAALQHQHLPQLMAGQQPRRAGGHVVHVVHVYKAGAEGQDEDLDY